MAGDELARVAQQIGDGAGQIAGFQIPLKGLAGGDDILRLVQFVAEKLGRALGHHGRGRDRVDANPITAQFARQRPGHADYGGFAGRVVQREGQAIYRRQRGDVDDAAAPAFPHRAHHRLATAPNTGDVDLHHLLPVAFGQLVKTPAAEAPIKRGVVNQAVDAAESVDGRRRHCRG